MALRLQKQRYLHRPEEGTYGDCHRTAIACLLGLERDTVPHWGVHYGTAQFDAEAKAFLAGRGLRALTFPVWADSPEKARWFMAQVNPGVYYLMVGKSRNGTNHVVICLDGDQVWDPAIDDSGIVGGAVDENGDSNWYWMDVIIPDAPLPEAP